MDVERNRRRGAAVGNRRAGNLTQADSLIFITRSDGARRINNGLYRRYRCVDGIRYSDGGRHDCYAGERYDDDS